MGAEIIGGALIGASGIFGSIMASETNSSNQQYGAEQSEESRKWATNERLATQEYNTQERLAVQDYNDPANQAMKMRSAGLNPAAISNGVRFVGSAPQSSSPGSAGGISPMGTNQVPNIPQLISSGSDLVNALAKHKETEASLPLIGEEVKYYVQKTYGEQLSNDLMKIEKEFKQSTLPASIKKVHEEVAKLEFEKIAIEKQGKVFEQEAKLKEAQERLAKMQESLTGEQAIQSHYLTDNWHRITDAMLQLQKSQTTSNYAQAKASNASARDLNATAEGKELLNNISRATNLLDIDNALFNADTLVLLQQSSDKQQIWQQLQRDIKKSSAYKNSENQKRIDASLEKLRQILGINVSIGASAHN